MRPFAARVQAAQVEVARDGIELRGDRQGRGAQRTGGQVGTEAALAPGPGPRVPGFLVPGFGGRESDRWRACELGPLRVGQIERTVVARHLTTYLAIIAHVAMALLTLVQ